MVISQTPYRISFFGGGTDYPAWFNHRPGSTLVSTIDKYSYLSCRYLPPFFDHKHRFAYSKIELANEIAEIQHPGIRGVLSYLNIVQGLSISHHGDLPARAGMGSSSAFTVGLVKALMKLAGENIDKATLAKMAIHIEQEVIKETVGSQDQIATAYGGINRVDFLSDGRFEVTPLAITKERVLMLQNNLLLFYTGAQRYASDIAKKQIQNLKHKEKELYSILSLVDEGQKMLLSASPSLKPFGELLNQAWLIKREIAEGVTTPMVDEIYNVGMSAGATGGKLLGAGGGGFILFYVEPQNQERVLKSMSGLVRIPFEFEFLGSRFIESQ